MAQITGEQRAQLRQRLLAWASEQETVSEETLSEQIEHLLEEVLHDEAVTPVLAPQAERHDEHEEDRRVVVTGLGLVTPFGVGIEPFWSSLEEGQSGITRITCCDVSDLPAQIAGEVRTFDPQHFMLARDVRHLARASQLALAAARLALDDAELSITDSNRHAIGTLVTSGSVFSQNTAHAMPTHASEGVAIPGPFALSGMFACQVAMHLGLQGYASTIGTGGAASTQSIGEAAAIIRRGDADVMLAGGAEAPINRQSLAGLCGIHALSTRNDEPSRASRPFDALRDGFVLAEGAGILVLERLSYARQRGASIYAEVAGYASICDAYHPIHPHPQGHGAARTMRRALMRAGIGPQQVDYIQAYASGLPDGDIGETLAIKRVFGEYATAVPVSAMKSMTGHLLSAAGGVEAAAALLGLTRDTIPPTINQEEADPACDLDYVPNAARTSSIQTVLANAYGFGGIYASLVFRHLDHAYE